MEQSWNIVGHERIISYLSHAIERNTYAHAYLFMGPHDCGMRPMVRKFVDSISPSEELRVSLEENKDGVLARVIKIDQIRDLITKLYSSVMDNGKRVVIIDPADALDIAGSNALLKTLEEPPRNTIIILIASHRSALLPTIVSRCQLLQFNVLSPHLAEDFLQQNYESVDASELVRHTGGYIGRAVALLNNSEERARIEHRYQILRECLKGPLHMRMSALSGMIEEDLGIMESILEESLQSVDDAYDSVLPMLDALVEARRAIARYVQIPLACESIMLVT